MRRVVAELAGQQRLRCRKHVDPHVATRAVGGLETQPQSLSAETEKVLHDEAWRGVAKKRGLLFESMVERDIATQGAFAPAAVMRSRHP